ncbi:MULTISPECIES: dihydrolipoamide acetyltransferase family protein [unclassified Rhodococcus (in: high G+C Gram-positive bacteria)]|uniref:dihydrolipoamide acetyltransferase family protein n=1 Tax=unclassified Rhodococcus (in: high G+C Gram-positive bacteria) TaxID=192944 RepID=UPI001C9AF242|nr:MULTISPECIES: dihydrolipoamide acetyltransferase family protein [unclassified Rhodococcus (in: high G+C Gram-positive bacteria)]MBY6684568.1 2-oxo acid dehydrogenase subunit E2 [Rhodococcus sp. BP-288]MBY6695465.1 2-oxo acid dehydrogenase subunit E2 [Rhodococcus sp. BP-188]MBY6698846.1 2-oxo acid dehydrogenase subunit E2 [Rhodococcus sp. BP-285]MBY6701525.1 2-oxo acid dehydrogenase subunit E2 [Rhodococcus sp. BP-283]MBY6707377.1 2-oxo acid dehydrogenase subunit E2 [Rhodococcus sp. BP-241]
MSTVKTFLLPDLGEGLADAELLTWSVDVGDTITLNQTIAEVETAKASVELPSPYAGVVVARHAEEGTTIDVGAPFLDIEVAGPATTGPASPDTADEAAADARPEPSVEKAESETVGAAPTRTPVLVGYGVAEETSSRRPLAAPPVRKEARERGIDLATVAPTGPHGNVTRDDLAVSSAPHADEERTPIKGVRKHTAEAMVRSAFTAPHVTEFVTVDVTPMMELLDELKASPLLAGVRVTPLALVAKALLIAVREHPSLNSSWDEAANEIVTKKYVNLGIAAATPRGLMVPNIKNAQTLGFRDLCSSLSALTAVAKEGKTGPAELADGTITITNIGVFGIDSGTPILTPGEAAILCFGAVRRQPWEYRGEIALRHVTTLSLSFDHRLVDGEQGSKFLSTVATLLSDPVGFAALG